MHHLTVVWSDAALPDGRGYVLAPAQFAKYRPPLRPHLTLLDADGFGRLAGALPAESVVSHWEAITPRLERVQGPLDGRAILPTFTCPFPGRDADLDAWYTNFHVPQVIEVEGFLAGRRYRRVDPHPSPPHEQVRLALYELDPTDLPAALERLQSRLGAMEPTDALDGATISSSCFVPAG